MKAVRLERLVGGKETTNSKKKENKETKGGSQLDSKQSQEKEEDKGKFDASIYNTIFKNQRMGRQRNEKHLRL